MAKGGESINPTRPQAPAVAIERAAVWAQELYGVEGAVRALPSYMDRNFLIEPSKGTAWVLKIANASEDRSALEFQNQAMGKVCQAEPGIGPRVRPSQSGSEIETIELGGVTHFVRLVSYLPGPLLADARHLNGRTWKSVGQLLARVDRALEDLPRPRVNRPLRWDLARADWTFGSTDLFESSRQRALIEYFQVQYLGYVGSRLAELPHSVIYNDANDHNIVVRDDPQGALATGIFDFGDVIYTARIFELAIACAYACLYHDDPLGAMTDLASGYHRELPLTDIEIDTLFAACCMRLVVSVTVSALDARLEPDNEYIRVSQEPAWKALGRLAELDPRLATGALRLACDKESPDEPGLPREQVVRLRRRHLAASLSLSYRNPIEMVRGRMQYLYDKTGRSFLDCVNNICHVGHCHPRIIDAAQRQMETLNTNTRYLHDNLPIYAQRLASLMPDPLQVCFFVNSGSEANELALRLARTYTGRGDMIAVQGGYHGITSSLVDLSPYKHDGPGGRGAPSWLHTVPCPDMYRGLYREDHPDAGQAYASHVAEAIDQARDQGRGIAALIAEPLIGCGGQIVPPDGYLQRSYAHMRAAGALCIADEVQIGFGRVGTHMWGFESQGVVPDIVTLGKPMGNGHPLAAVVTRPDIAEAFDDGMEFFSSFGGNPVSCAIGLAVLDVIEEEGMQQHAGEVGNYLLAECSHLADRHEAIGDVRGQGLYLGVELVESREQRRPAPALAASVIEYAREVGVLLSSDGPDRNVLKIKPPLPFGQADADLLVSVLDTALSDLGR